MEFFSVKFFTQFSRKKYIKLLFPSIIPFITGACGRQSFMVGTSGGTASLAESPAKALNAESRELWGREGAQTQEPHSLSWTEVPSIRPKPPQPSSAGGHGSTAETTGGP